MTPTSCRISATSICERLMWIGRSTSGTTPSGSTSASALASQAVFLAEGLYHHHIGANSWQSAGASPAPQDAPGLDSFELRLRDVAAVDAANERLERAGVTAERDESTVRFRDADENLVLLTAGPRRVGSG